MCKLQQVVVASPGPARASHLELKFDHTERAARAMQTPLPSRQPARDTPSPAPPLLPSLPPTPAPPCTRPPEWPPPLTSHEPPRPHTPLPS